MVRVNSRGGTAQLINLIEVSFYFSGITTFICLLYYIIYYLVMGWWSQPTFGGSVVMMGLLLCATLFIYLGCRVQSHSQLVINIAKTLNNRFVFIPVFYLLILVLALTLILNLKPDDFPVLVLQRHRPLIVLVLLLVSQMLFVLGSLRWEIYKPILSIGEKFLLWINASLESNIKTRIVKVLGFGRPLLQNEFVNVSILLAMLILLYLSPTLIQGKLPLSTSYLYQMSPWSSLAGKIKNDMIVNPVQSDVYDGLIPALNFTYNEVKSGDYPLWLPYVNGGVPHGLLLWVSYFSLNLVVDLLVGLKWGTILYMALKMFIVGIFFYFYIRYRKLSQIASLMGSLTLMFSATLIVNGMQNVHDAVVYAPAILYFAERFVREKKYWLFFGLAISAGMTVASGFPSVTLYTLLLVTIYIAFRTLIELNDRPLRERAGSLAIVAFGFIVGIALVLVTLLPTYDFFKETNLEYRVGRGTTILEGIQAGRLIIPNVCGNPVRTDWICGAGNYNGSAVYVGLLPIMFIPFSLANKKNNQTSWFFFIAAVLVLMIVFGVGPLYRIVGSLPFFNSNPNTRMIALLPLCFAFVLSIGTDNLATISFKKGYWSLILYLILLICTLFLFEQVYLIRVKGDEIRDYLRQQELCAVLLLICYSVIIASILTFKNRRFLSGIMSLLLIINFMEHAFLLGGNEGASYPETFYPVTPAISFLMNELPKEERIAVIGRHFPPSFPLYYSINSLTGHTFADPAYKGNLELINPGIFAGNTTQPIFRSNSINLLSPLLDLYRVRYIVTPPGDEPIWFVSLAEQREYNDSIELGGLKSFGQSITISRSGFSDILQLRMKAPIPDIPVHIKITADNKLLTEFYGQLVMQEPDYYSIELPKVLLEAGQHILFVITPVGNPFPPGSSLFTVDFDIYEGGALLINGKEMKRDAAFVVLENNPAIAEKYKKVHGGDLNIYENVAMGSEIPVVGRLITSDQDSCAATLDQIDPAVEAVIEDENLAISGSDVNSSALIQEYSPDKVVIKADVEHTSMVILSDTYYSGWRAMLDGKETKIHRVNCAMRGVIVLPGEHLIEMYYEPPSFKIGLGLSLFTFIGLLFTGMVVNIRRRVI